MPLLISLILVHDLEGNGSQTLNRTRKFRATVVEKPGAGSTAQTPIEWLSDNSSCYTAIETRIFAKQLGLKPVRTPVESPQSNGMVESFVKTFKRDYARLANRPDSQTVMRELKLRFEHYNEKHPHSAFRGTGLPGDSGKSRRQLTNTDGPAIRGRVY